MVSCNPKFLEKLQAYSNTIVGDEGLQREIDEDEKLMKIKQELQSNPMAHPRYSIRGRILSYKGRLVILKGSRFISSLLTEFHSISYGRHSSFYRTYKWVVATLYWEGMKRDIKKFVAECDVCQCMKYEAMSLAGLLQPLPMLERIWEDLLMDFILGLPKVKGMDSILVVINPLSKYRHFMTLRHSFIAKEVAEVFIREVVHLHGFPQMIVTNRDCVFMSEF